MLSSLKSLLLNDQLALLIIHTYTEDAFNYNILAQYLIQLKM